MFVTKYLNAKISDNKFALLWGEAQLCLLYVCLPWGELRWPWGGLWLPWGGLW